jgi:hypothetical protein
MAYATRDDVLARAGRFAGLFSVAGKRPDLSDLDDLLDSITSEIDVEIAAHGYNPAAMTDDLVASLKDVAAWAVLVRSLPQASPGDNAIDDTIQRGLAILAASGFPALGGGVNVMGALEALEAGAGGGGAGTSAGSLWDDLPSESLWSRFRRGDVAVLTAPMGDFSELVDEAEAGGPQFRRGQSL